MASGTKSLALGPKSLLMSLPLEMGTGNATAERPEQQGWIGTRTARNGVPVKIWKIVDYYAALLLKEGAAYCVALCLFVCLSVCLSVCPSVPLLLTLEHRSRVFVNLADVQYLLFCLHVRAAYSTAISAAQACFVLRFILVCGCFYVALLQQRRYRSM